MKRRFGQILALAAVFAGQEAAAEAARLQADFTFRRVQVPVAGAVRRITVQIAPQAPKAPSAPSGPGAAGGATDAVAGATPRVSELGWFWDAVSPDIGQSGPGRLGFALDAMGKASASDRVVPPRLQALQEIAQSHGTEILRRTVGTKVSPALVLAVIAVESAGKSNAVSRVGAQGLMQLMPPTASRFGVTDALDAADNIKGGVAYLEWLMGEFDQDPILVLAAYNAGEGAVRKNGGVPNYDETRAYVPKVLAAWTVARGLCITPPELMTDGCVFTVAGG